MIPVGEGNARVIRRRHHGGNPGDDFKRNFFLGQPLGFLAAPAENIRIAAFQPHHVFAGFGAIHHQLRKLLLGETAIALVVAACDDFRAGRREPQQFRIDQHVANDHFRAPEQFRSAQRQQTRVAGAGPDQINSPMRFHSDSLCKVFSQVNRLCRPRAGAQVAYCPQKCSGWHPACRRAGASSPADLAPQHLRFVICKGPGGFMVLPGRQDAALHGRQGCPPLRGQARSINPAFSDATASTGPPPERTPPAQRKTASRRSPSSGR